MKAFLEKKKKNPGPVHLFPLQAFGFEMVEGHTPVFTEYVQVQHVYGLVIWFGFVLSLLVPHLLLPRLSSMGEFLDC